MKFFVTGATGFIGHELVKKLLENGYRVNILVRSPEKLDLPDSENLKIYVGNLSDTGIIEKGVEGCDGVYHLAAYANIWSKNKNLPYEINVTGTKNILEAALKKGIKKFVFTSTAGVLKPSENHELIDESSPMPYFYLTDYEKSKSEAEKLSLDYHQKGLPVVIVRPSKVYGPGILNKSNSLTRIMKLYLRGRWRFIPGNGKTVSNYVYIRDVVDGHIKAMLKGISGEIYILGGINASYNQFFKTVAESSGINRKFLRLPSFIMAVTAHISVLVAGLAGIQPLITPAWLKKFMQNQILSSKKAGAHFDYRITPLETGIRETIEWLKTRN